MVTLAGCGTLKASSKGKDPVMLDHAGRALGSSEIPKWLQVYNANRSVTAVEAMSEFKSDYCFILEDEGANLDALQAWANTVEMMDTIAARISTRVGSTAEANVSAENKAKYSGVLNDVRTTTRNATFNGAVKNSEYWVKWRNYDPDDAAKYTDEFTIYLLYTMRKDLLDTAIAQEFQEYRNRATSDEERQMWTGLIQAVLEKGLDVEAKVPSQESSHDVNIKVFN